MFEPSELHLRSVQKASPPANPAAARERGERQLGKGLGRGQDKGRPGKRAEAPWEICDQWGFP